MLPNPAPQFLRPVTSDQFLPPISRWTTLGGLFLVGTVGAAFTLAAVTKYNITVKAPATVRPSGEIRLVQAAVEGTVKSIPVKENMVVKQGDAIAIVDNSQLQTKKSQLQGNLQQGQLQLDKLAAQISSLDTQRDSESSLMNRTIASAQADLSRNQREYRDKLITTQTEVKEAEAALELAKAQMQHYQQLNNTGAISVLQIKEKEQAFKASVARLERTKATLNPSAATVTMASERIAQEKAKGESTLATLNKERESLLQRSVEIENQLNRDARELQQIETELKKGVIRAPASGIILQLNLRNPGQVVRAAESVAQIAPDKTPIVVKARVAAQDIGTVALNQKVRLRISAYPYPNYGTLNGKVSAIAPDATTPGAKNPETQNSGASAIAPYYEVTIDPEKLYLKDNPKNAIQPGMEITADIIAREETVLTFILRKARLLTDL